jgi:hypothetical protein
VAQSLEKGLESIEKEPESMGSSANLLGKGELRRQEYQSAAVRTLPESGTALSPLGPLRTAREQTMTLDQVQLVPLDPRNRWS